MLFSWLPRSLSWLAPSEDIQPLYRALCHEARLPFYYGPRFGVPDSFDGRFEMLLLVAHLLLRRLGNRVDGGDDRVERQQQRLARRRSQRLFDRLFADLKRDLHESGFGDAAVDRQLQAMTSAFFGRMQAYGAAQRSNDAEQMRAALRNNLYGSISPTSEQLELMSARIIELKDHLDRLSDQQILAGWLHPTPHR